MEELLFFIFGMIAEALGLKKKAVPPPAPLAPMRRDAPSSSVSPNGGRKQIPLPMPLSRRPDAGDPFVLADPTTRSFAEREQALEASASTKLKTPPGPDTTAPLPAPTLFAGTDDFVRAFVLQEALGPPLCRRHGSLP